VQQREDVDPQVDIQCSVDDAFQGPHEAAVLEDRVQDALLHAFTMADGVHAEYIRNDGDETDPLPDYRRPMLRAHQRMTLLIPTHRRRPSGLSIEVPSARS
jgi:hypothetical protein